MSKESFVFYLDWIEHLAMLDPPEVMLVLKEIQAHIEGGSAGNLSGAAAMAFCFIRAQLDRDLNKWNDTRKKRAEAGRLGAMVTNSRQKAANPANADFDEQKAANPAVNVPVPVNVPVIESKADKPPRSRFVAPNVDEVRQYCKERKNAVDPETFVDFYESKGWKVGKETMKDWKAAVRTWERREDKTGKDVIVKNEKLIF